MFKIIKKLTGPLLISLLFVGNAFGATENITQINITNTVQSIMVNTISEKFTIQTQNAGGASENLGETSDLTLKSTSGTGEFSSSNTSWENDSTHTMSKNSANRSFYYKDSTAGNYTITAEVKTRTGGKTWTTTQAITIGSGSSSSNSSNTTGTTASSTESGTESTNTASTDSSSHSSGVPISVDDIVYELQVSLGRGRVGFVGVPLEFQGKIAKSKNVYSLGKIDWSFGDGTAGSGERVSHTYWLPGEYVVILNTNSNGIEAVDRGVVRIYEPKLSFGIVDDNVIEIKNLDSREINMGNWKVSHNNKTYTIPNDTIILGNKSLKLSQKYLMMALDESKPFELLNPNNYPIASYNFNSKISQEFSNKIQTQEILNSSSTVEVIDEKIVKARQERVRARLLKFEREGLNINAVEDPGLEKEVKIEGVPVENKDNKDIIIKFEEKRGLWGRLINILRP